MLQTTVRGCFLWSKNVVGLNKYEAKDRRRQRRNYEKNHIAHDLLSPKYRRKRVIENKKAGPPEEDEEFE